MTPQQFPDPVEVQTAPEMEDIRRRGSHPVGGQRLVWTTLMAAVCLMPRPAAALVLPRVTEVSPLDGAKGVRRDTMLVVHGRGGWQKGAWVELTLIEAATAKDVPIERVSVTWGEHIPDRHQPYRIPVPGGGTYTDTVLTYKPRVMLKAKTRYILRWNFDRPGESRFTTGSRPSPRAAPSRLNAEPR